MALRGTDPESYNTEYTLVCGDKMRGWGVLIEADEQEVLEGVRIWHVTTALQSFDLRTQKYPR